MSHEIWKIAAPLYQMMKENPPTDTELCPCVNDITANGILTRLVKTAKDLKYFNSKRQPRRKKEKDNFYGNYGCFSGTYSSRCSRNRRSTEEDATPEMIEQYEAEYLADSSQENAWQLMKVKPWKLNSLVGPEQWVSYEAMLTTSMMTDEEFNDFVTFMYCKLNQPKLDYPKELFDKIVD